MKKTLFLLPFLCLSLLKVKAEDCIPDYNDNEDPSVINYVLNTTFEKNAEGDTVNVTSVYYTDCDIYVVTSGIANYAEYDVAKFNPGDLDRSYKLTRVPTVATIPENTGSQVGIFLDGSAIMAPEDEQYYNGWARLAGVFELSDFDSTWGHSTATNVYHHHITNLAYLGDGSQHSPLIGYAFDGYPIYGPYGYDDPADENSSIRRITSSYEVVAQFVTDGDRYSEDTDAPAVTKIAKKDGSSGPLGAYTQDFEYTGSGDLDEHNGRFCITPEYPSGTYAYFSTLDEDGTTAAYPYFVGPTFYGENYTSIKSGGYSATIPSDAVEYEESLITSISSEKSNYFVQFYSSNNVLLLQSEEDFDGEISVYSLNGQLAFKANTTSNGMHSISNLSGGAYIAKFVSTKGSSTAKFLK